MPEFWITLFEQLKESKVALLILVGAGMFLVIGGLAALSHCYTLSGIKSRTVGLPQRRSSGSMPMSRSESGSGAAATTAPQSRGWCWGAKAKKVNSPLW